MDSYIVMGLFAFFAAGTSLFRFMGEPEFYRITAMKRHWGRKRGLTLHFVSSVVVPMLFGLVFLSGGVSGVELNKPLVAEKPFERFNLKVSPLPDYDQDGQLFDSFTNLAA